MEREYFSCNNTPNATTVCNLKNIALQYSYTTKVTSSNAFSIYLIVKPNIPTVARLSWLNGISFANHGIIPISHTYDSSSGTLALTASYSSDVGSSPIDFHFNYQDMNNNLVSSIPSIAMSQTLIAENNLSLQSY